MSVAREKRIQEAMAEAMKRMADLEAENAKLRERIERMDLEMQVEIATLDDKIAEYLAQKAENARLNEKIEQLELLESRSAAEAKAERERAEFWKVEADKRVKLILDLESENTDPNDIAESYYCPCCVAEIDNTGRPPHRDGCRLARLMTMPEEPKP